MNNQIIKTNIINDIAVSISKLCSLNSVNSQSININNVQASTCDLIMCGNQNVESKINNSCTQSSSFSNDLEQSVIDSIVTNTSIVSNTIKNLIDIKAITSCITNNINKQDFTLNGLKVSCAPTVDIYGYSTPGKLNICEIDQHIASELVTNCSDSIDSKFFSAIKEAEGTDTSTEAPNMNMDIDQRGLLITGIVLTVIVFIILLFLIIYAIVIATRT